MDPLFKAAVDWVRGYIPEFEVRYKNESWSSKIIAALVWVFNRDYLTRYTTTRYPRVYFPSRAFVANNPTGAVKILAHEFVHLWDRKEQGVWFTISYALPQLAALFLLLVPIVVAFFQPWWVALLCAIPGLLCLLPLPAYWRMKLELRGYTMSMAMNYWRYGSVADETVQWITQQFTGWPYYKMWPFRATMTKRIHAALDDIKQKRLGQPFSNIEEFLNHFE